MLQKNLLILIFLTWKRQILPFIRSQDLDEHLDGLVPIPPRLILQETKDKKGDTITISIKNPEYTAWRKRDQSLVAYITSTLSQEVLVILSDDCTAADLWSKLSQTYSQISEARVMYLKNEFQSLKKGSMSVMEYIGRLKSITDQLAVVGSAIADKDKV